MKVGHVSGQRQQPLDRASATIGAFYWADGVGAHEEVERFLYTVPTGFKAIITQAEAIVQRATAAGTVGRVKAYVDTTPGYVTRAHLLKNNIGDAVHSIVPFEQPLFAGDYVGGYTEDLSDTGSVDYVINFVGYLIPV